ncbi:molecular chaperone DnaJ [Actinoplanes oblitus]|uniref:Molecular chaperone DnaJ n=1 Tax=Actinoplanes oblitus TaxID=3040509 RepID=A0ABY8WBT3_9ACTN|nr:molecular chaperone DnaJ [Actinoplanes oblitus]WIM94942.1 molecular chaperone DnaJ [Actinoplanes oblitus]
MRASFEEVAAAIRAAGTFAELVDTTGVDSRRQSAYRILARIVHPDAAGPALREPATAAFTKLHDLYQHPGAWRSGDIADLHEDGDLLVKIPRSPLDNDLMAAEASALGRLRSHGHPDFQAYAPRLITSEPRDGRTVNVLTRRRGFRDLTGSRDLTPADLVWIWRRLLAGLGWAHRAGLVHGAVFEEHVLIEPRRRGLVLVDWCYATGAGTRPKAIIAKRERDYPPEVLARQPVTAATDIHLATQLMIRLFGSAMPDPLRRFADGCRFHRPPMRPQNAWRLLTELDALIPPQYRI